MKKTWIAAMMLTAMMTATACGTSSQPAATQAPAASETAAAAEAAPAEGAELKEIEAGSCETPAILTSIGQSADVDIVNTLCSKAGIEMEKNNNITADELPADCKTLVLAVGGSSKGLGAAGIDADQELERTAALLEKAKSQGTKIVAVHTGGSARRGTLSDSFIVPAFEAADIGVIVAEGDGDGMMQGILAKNGAAGASVAQVADCVAVMSSMFGK